MHNYFSSRLNKAMAASIVLVFLFAYTASASSLLISMGNGASQQWQWHETKDLPGAFYTIVTSKEQAGQVAKKLPVEHQSTAFQGIDFTKRVAIVAYLGEAPRGGYAVDINSVQITNNQIWINVSRRSPAADEVTTLAVTHPLAVKTLAQSDLPQGDYTVTFTDQNGKTLATQTATRPMTVSMGKDSMLQWNWNYTKPLQGATYTIVTSRKEANRIAAGLPEQLRVSAFKNINFKKQVAVMAYLGTAPNSGFAIDIHSVVVNGDKIQVVVGRRSPLAREVTLPMVTFPMAIKPLSLTALPPKPYSVQFVDQKGTVLGEQTIATRTITHVVQPGQTLWYIAWLHGVKVENLLRWNGLNATSMVKPGMVLKI